MIVYLLGVLTGIAIMVGYLAFIDWRFQKAHRMTVELGNMEPGETRDTGLRWGEEER